MGNQFERQLHLYGELAVRVGLNLRAGQRLLVIGPLASGGVSLEAVPLVRHVAASAYRAGARMVEAIWGDEQLQMIRFRDASHDSFSEYSAWLPQALVEHVESGNAVLSIYANDPDLLKDQTPERITAVQRATARGVQAFRELVSRNQTNWTVVAAAAPGWAAKVFPDLAPEQQMSGLWQAIGHLCRLDAPDPVSAWEAHLATLASRERSAEWQAVRRIELRGPRNRADGRARARSRLGEWTVGDPVRHIVRSESSYRGSLHDATQGSGPRDCEILETSQLRRHAD